MLVRVIQKGVSTVASLDGIVMEPGSSVMSCTAYEYGTLLTEAVEPLLAEQAEAIIEVSDNNKVVHRLALTYKEGECYISDWGEMNLRPTVEFKRRTEKLPDRYLIIVDAGRNRNEFYKMCDLGGGEWGATTGRIGEKQSRSRRTRNVVVPKTYPDYMFCLKHLEKRLGGYVDKSDCHSVKVIKQKNYESEVSGIDNEQVADLLEKLMNFANMAIKANYNVSYTDVTEVMIQQAHDALNAMRASTDIPDFNKNLISLMHIIPRKIDRGGAGVTQMLARDAKDYADILIRESELLDIMEGQINLEKHQTNDDRNLLEKLGLEVYEATEEEMKEVRGQLNRSLQPSLRRVFRIINRRTQERFDDYLSEYEGTAGNKPEVRLFWHGSRNQNWFSIVQKGLLLNPDAVITGKMFGQGVYFAPSAVKSWGYTSGLGAIWTNGQSPVAYMALYATAYGKPYKVYHKNESWYNYNYKRLQKEHPDCCCVHAKADCGMLYNDEIIFYREDQVSIKYICEFGA